MKRVIILLLIILNSCTNMSNNKRERFPYKEYFDKDEIQIAEFIYYGEVGRLNDAIIRGANINHVGKEGFTYLMYAVLIEQYDVVECLLKNGADPNLISPLMKTKRNNINLREKKDWRPVEMLPLEVCSGSSNYSIKYMKLLLKYGANINDDRTKTPIDEAVLLQDMEKLKFLIANGANINLVYGKNTPIMTAVVIMSWDIVDYLLDCGADVFYVAEDGYSVGLLLQEYSDRDAWNRYGRKRIEGLIERLKQKGVKFPATKLPPTPVSKSESTEEL